MNFEDLKKKLENNETIDKRKFCELIFPQVSRTFAVNVVKLPEPLRFQVLISYLLCRIADTIEDNELLATNRKKEILSTFSNILSNENWQEQYQSFEDECQKEICGEQVDIILLHHSKYVLYCFFEFPEKVQEYIRKWVQEMASGMSEYAIRKISDADVTFLNSLDDLEKYCYYVAGTVGHLLNGLFFHHYDVITEKHYNIMEENATSFGLGLQLTNIIKDSIVDYQRGWCYLPSDLLEKLSLTGDNLLKITNRQNAYELMNEIIKRAKEHLDNALLYSCAIPRRALRVRVFCFLPLMMAIKTLEKATFNEQLFNVDNPVKISREEVKKIVKYTQRNVWSNTRMARWYKRVVKSLEKKLENNLYAS